jgi:hypothetical protein
MAETALRSRREPMVCNTPAFDAAGTVVNASRKTSSTWAPGILCSAQRATVSSCGSASSAASAPTDFSEPA